MFSEELGRCHYFEVAVLPADPLLHGEYLTARTLGTNAIEISMRHRCEKCQTIFHRKSNRSNLCPKCSEWQRRMKNREYQQAHKQKKVSV
ncbi:MAG: hypothetical protein KMY50_00435 [Candidatus Desulforudis sp.]|nr:hypothetical protein [Desulforudis sp.]